MRKDTVSRNQFSLQNRTDSWIASEYSEIFRWLGGKEGDGGGGLAGPSPVFDYYFFIKIIIIIIIIIIFIIIIIINCFCNAAEMNAPKQSAGFADSQQLIEKDALAYR